MTNENVYETYMNSPRFEADMDAFRVWLRERGYSEATIHDQTRYARHAEKVLGGDLDPRDCTQQHNDLLELRIKGLSKKTRDGYYRSWLNFVDAVTDGTPRMDGLPYWRTKDFEDDIARFRAFMAETGSPENYIRDCCKYVKHCFKTLAVNGEDLRPSDVNEDVIERLEDMMWDGIKANTRVRYLRTLGMYVQFMTGSNPYRELTVPDTTNNFTAYLYQTVVGEPWEDELTLYIGAMEHRGYRMRTIISKVRSVIACGRRLCASEWSGELNDITPEDITYLRTLFDDVKESTVQVYFRNFGLFIEFITGYNPVPDAVIMWNPDQDLVERRFIFKEQWRSLVEHAEPDEYLILILGATMGLRRFEIADLRLDDIKDGQVRIRGKGHGPDGKVVYKDLNTAVEGAIRSYMPHRSRILALYGDHSDGHLLVRKNVYPGEFMTADCVGDIVHRLGKRAGVDCSTHCLRRLYATTLYDRGTDIDTLRRMMRHEQVNTTLRCYLDADPRKIAEAESGLLDDLELS